MTAGIKILIITLILLAALMVLSFIGPDKGGSRLWRVVQRLRAILDAASYWLFNVFAIGTVILGVVMIIRHVLQ